MKKGIVSLVILCMYTHIHSANLKEVRKRIVGNSYGWTPLFEAVQYSNTFKVRDELENGASVNAHDNAGYPPLAHARDPQIVQILLEAKADVTIQNHLGDYPIHSIYNGMINDGLLFGRICPWALQACKSLIQERPECLTLKNKYGQTIHMRIKESLDELKESVVAKDYQKNLQDLLELTKPKEPEQAAE